MSPIKSVLVFLALSLTSVVYSQDVEKDSYATVYVYMPHHSATSWRFSGKFYVDDKRVAEISKNRYFVLRLPPGNHSFYVRDKKLGGAEKSLAANESYYIKVNVDEGGFRVKFRGVSFAPEDEAKFTIHQISPIKRKDVYDKNLVDMSITSP